MCNNKANLFIPVTAIQKEITLLSSQRLEMKSFKRSETCILNGNGYRFSHSKSNKFNDVNVHRASSQRANLKGLHAALLILTRTLHGCSFLENAGAYSPE